MTSRKRIEDSERWRAFGRIEAGQSIHRCCSFLRRSSFCNFTFMETIPNHTDSFRRPVGGRPRVTTPRGRLIYYYCSQEESQSDLHTCGICGYSVHWLWCKQGTRNQPQNITEHHEFRGGTIMVWAGILLGYRTDLHLFKQGSATVVRYRDGVLESILRLYNAAVGPIFVLMDDNAHPHRADIVDDYLESEGIARTEWTAYSPDLNPIENLWDVLGRALSLRFQPPATLIVL
ncbi:transposable element Tcb1 transposase [Trichonephila clavipes]|uniref:Transposable element Tcb1 transposase n=1 Tax=Trichonephila clavipes TaxID=2585209 RepID=A0A8X6W2M9_TRICX|nr:transposable element Tcb1 transposase [Trichonephila clavipes]